MSPSIGLVAALAAAGLSPLAHADSGAIPAGLCVRAEPEAPARADDKDADLFDAAKDALDDGSRARLTAAGARLDATDCRLLAADGHALTRREVEALAGKKADAAKKPPSDDAKKAAAAKLAVGSLAAAGGAAGTYADSTRRFDGAAAGGAETALPGAGAARGQSAELQASAMLTAGFQEKFQSVPAGQALVKDFTDKGARLPPVLLADLGGGSTAALYDRDSRTVQLDLKNAAQFVVDTAPESERPGLTKQFADPARFSAYLLAHPEARAAVLDGADVSVFHEDVHAWQQRRDLRVDAVEGKDPVEWEREAYREEILYYHQKVMRDPTLEARSNDDTLYRELLRGYPGFKKDVTELYVNGNGSSEFKTIEQILADRARRGRPGAASSLAALKKTASDYSGREDDFAGKTVPAMQAEAFPKLIDRQLAAGHPEEALALAFDAPAEIRDARGPAAFAATRRLLESAKPAPVADRLKAWDAYVAYQRKTTGSNELDAGLYAIYQRDRRDGVEYELSEAAKARDAMSREAAFAWARSFASELPEQAGLLKRIAAAEGGRARAGS